MAIGDVTASIVNPIGYNGAYFDGVDDKIDISNSMDTNFLLSECTISCFLFRYYSTNEQAILMFGFDFAGDKGIVISLEDSDDLTNPDKLRLVVGGTINTGIGAAFPIGEWAHLLVQFNNSGTIKYYINGVLSEEKTGTGTIAGVQMGSGVANQIGSQQNGRYFYGKMRDVRVYNRYLSDDEILKISRGDFISNGLINHWNLTENFNNSIGDKNGTASGTLINNTGYDDVLKADLEAKRVGASDKYFITEVNGKILSASIAES